ncbi:MAG: ferredoxin [Gemmatimonadales bacterium]
MPRSPRTSWTGRGATSVSKGCNLATIEREVGDLRLAIDPSLCVAFADCVTLAPEAFHLNDAGVIEFGEPERVERERLIAACDACPVDALLVWDAQGTRLVP